MLCMHVLKATLLVLDSPASSTCRDLIFSEEATHWLEILTLVMDNQLEQKMNTSFIHHPSQKQQELTPDKIQAYFKLVPSTNTICMQRTLPINKFIVPNLAKIPNFWEFFQKGSLLLLEGEEKNVC